MMEKPWVSSVRRCASYVLFAVSLGVVAWFMGGWLGHLGRAKPPAGFEETAIPGVFVDRHVADLGVVVPDRVVKETFHLINRGPHAYVVRKTVTDCGCASVHLGNSLLPPQGSLTIPLKVDVSRLAVGSFEKGVLVDLSWLGHDDSYRDAFRVKGRIDRSGTFIAWPAVIDCGATTPKAIIVRELYFQGDRALLAQLPSRLEIHELPYHLRLVPIEAAGQLDVRSVEVRLALPPDTPMGLFESAVTVEVPGSPTRRVQFDVRGLMTSGIMVTPRRVLLTATDGGLPTATIHIRSTDGMPCLVKSISSATPIQWILADHSEDNDTVAARLFMTEAAPGEGPIITHLTIKLHDGRATSVPMVIMRLDGPKGVSYPQEGQTWR